MKLPFSAPLFIGCAAAVLTLGACANQPNNVAKRGTSATGAAHPGTIPTRNGQDSQSVAGNEVGGANGQEYRVVTGSNIPRVYNRRGYSTDSADPVEIYDENDIRFRSQTDTGNVLRTIPSATVSGPP